jgi:prophage antirepressor-like protein
MKLITPQNNQHGECGFTEQEVIVINEPAVYQLACRSNKQAAQEFARRVFSEVLRSFGRLSDECRCPARVANDRVEARQGLSSWITSE